MNKGVASNSFHERQSPKCSSTVTAVDNLLVRALLKKGVASNSLRMPCVVHMKGGVGRVSLINPFYRM